MGYYVPPRPRTKHRQSFHLAAFHNKPCPYCGHQMQVHYPNPHHHRCCPTRDHIIPRSLGGRRTVVVCMGCNNLKVDMHPNAWVRYLADVMPERVEAVRLLFLREVGLDVRVSSG